MRRRVSLEVSEAGERSGKSRLDHLLIAVLKPWCCDRVEQGCVTCVLCSLCERESLRCSRFYESASW
jgi:hypothetical protein